MLFICFVIVMLLQWEKWLSSWHREGDKCEGQAELLAQIINLCDGHWISEDQVFDPQYQSLLQLTNTLCNRLRCHQKDKVSDTATIITYPTTNTTSQLLATFQTFIFCLHAPNAFFFYLPHFPIKHKKKKACQYYNLVVYLKS